MQPIKLHVKCSINPEIQKFFGKDWVFTNNMNFHSSRLVLVWQRKIRNAIRLSIKQFPMYEDKDFCWKKWKERKKLSFKIFLKVFSTLSFVKKSLKILYRITNCDSLTFSYNSVNQQQPFSVIIVSWKKKWHLTL